MNEPLEVRKVRRDRVRDGALEIGPNELVWIELRGVAWEAMQAQTSSRAQELLYEDATVLVDVVPNDEDRAIQPLEQQAQESNDIRRADVPVAQEPGVKCDPLAAWLDTDR